MIKRFVEKHDKLVTRILEIIPGLLSWAVILSPIWLSIIYPPAVVFLLIFFTLYWCYLAVSGTIGGFIGYGKYKKEMSTDWMGELDKLNFAELPEQETLPKNLEDTYHFILIPTVNEPESILKPAIDAIFDQTFPTENIFLVYALEEKYAKTQTEVLERLVNSQKRKLHDFQIYVHPAGIPGEAIGAAGANRTWGARHAVKHLEERDENIRNYIFTTIDSDHVLDPQYIARLTHLYVTNEKRDYKYYSSAVYTFNNNNWEVPALMRIEANFVTLGTLADWGTSGKEAAVKDTFSAYSASLQTLLDADYWDASLGIDDTLFYWRAFFARKGDFVGVSHYIPFSADAVGGETYFGAYKSLYKQLLRWGYGVIDFPLSMKQFLINKEVPFGKKFLWTIRHLKVRTMLINMVFLITFGFSLATLINPNLRQTSFAYSLPDTISFILTFTMLFLVPSFWLRSKLSSPMPKDWPIWRKSLILLEAPLVIVNLLTYSFIPFIDAQTRMMFGKKMADLYHTPKVRK